MSEKKSCGSCGNNYTQRCADMISTTFSSVILPCSQIVINKSIFSEMEDSNDKKRNSESLL